ncbi:MAG: hypothetical protein RL754_876 [Bacteroidota bacterium]|jgi:carboxyl-terminal processing protease
MIKRLGIVVLGAALMGASMADPFETSKQLEIFTAVLKEVQTQYVDEVGAEMAVESAIKGMLEELDPYTVYYPEDQIEDVRLLQTGEYGGIGCVIQKVGEDMMIAQVYPEGPAGKAGLRVGDVITKVGTTSTAGKSTGGVSGLLKGTPGTPVKLEVQRYGVKKAIEMELVRANIAQDPVPFYGMREDGVGYVYLESFTEKAAAQVQKALLALKKEEPKAIILDLRGNGGGLLNEAVKIVSMFSDRRDTVVFTRGRGGAIEDVYKTMGKPIFPELPLAVLIDEGSASASEIVAGALQDFDRAVILGEKSYGKGLVQQIHPLPFGAQMKVTIAKYYTPSGRCIQKINYDRDESGNRTTKEDQRAFTTRGGRRVFDGGGIDPDSTLENNFYPEWTMALSAKGLDLKFAGTVMERMQEVENAGQFHIDDAIWGEFKDFLSANEFDFKSLAELRLEDLGKDAQFLDYLDEADLEALLNKVRMRQENVLNDKEEDLRAYLSDYLAEKHFSIAGSLERALVQDIVIDNASKILLDPQTKTALLSVK